MSKWSWSKVNSFYLGQVGDGCLYSWQQAYQNGNRGEGNWFAEVGLLAHDLIERYNKGELSDWDLPDEFEKGFNKIPYKVFPKMAQSYFKTLAEFFGNNFDWFNDYKMLESEDKKEFMVGEYLFTGFPDLVARHKELGLVIMDIKTAKTYTGDKLKHNLMQLYLYSIPIYEKYGEWPQHLVFFYPREATKQYIHKFSLDELEETKQFCIDTINQIEVCKDFPARCQMVNGDKDFFANQLCNLRNDCPYKINY